MYSATDAATRLLESVSLSPGAGGYLSLLLVGSVLWFGLPIGLGALRGGAHQATREAGYAALWLLLVVGILTAPAGLFLWAHRTWGLASVAGKPGAA